MSLNIVIAGAGPGGMATAVTLAAINPHLNITVMDNRETTKRNYGLAFASDSIQAIQAVLKKHNANSSLIDFFATWKGQVVSTVDIESNLAERAKELGIKILRKKEYKSILTPQGIGHLLDATHQPQNSSAEFNELRECFTKADIIIGADGAHSDIRKKFMTGGDEEKKVDVKNLQYFIELKYQTHQSTKKRKGLSNMNLKGSRCEGVGSETLRGDKGGSSNPLKPGTMHFFVGQTTYDHFEKATNETPWDLERLQEEAVNDPVIANTALKIAYYLKSILDRGGCCIDEKIKRLPITVYRSSQAVTMHDKKIVVLVGDALSGLVFARGVNKAFLEAAKLAETINIFNTRKIEVVSGQVPAEFQKYQDDVFKLYEREKKWAIFLATGLKAFRTLLRWTIKPLQWIVSPFSALFQTMKGWFIKEPSLGELMKRLKEQKKSH